DGAPFGDEEDCGAEDGAEYGAEFLHSPDDAEGCAALACGPEVGDEGEGCGQESPASDSLDDASCDECGQVGGEGGDDGSEYEDGEAQVQHPLAFDEVCDASDEWEYGDVAEQEAGDDGCCFLQRVDGDSDIRHHVGEGEHDDVRVG